MQNVKFPEPEGQKPQKTLSTIIKKSSKPFTLETLEQENVLPFCLGNDTRDESFQPFTMEYKRYVTMMNQ